MKYFRTQQFIDTESTKSTAIMSKKEIDHIIGSLSTSISSDVRKQLNEGLASRDEKVVELLRQTVADGNDKVVSSLKKEIQQGNETVMDFMKDEMHRLRDSTLGVIDLLGAKVLLYFLTQQVLCINNS